jgi:Transposase
MKAKRFTEEQIIAVLKEAEAGAKTKDLCRKYGISDVTFYNWKAKYAGLTARIPYATCEARSRRSAYLRGCRYHVVTVNPAPYSPLLAAMPATGRWRICGLDRFQPSNDRPSPLELVK